MTYYSQSDSNDSAYQESKEQIDSAAKYKWPSDAVKLLLKFRFEMEHEFSNPTGKKILLWNHISDKLAEHKHHFSGKLCFAKFRNLTATYRRRKEMGDSYCQWEHMEVMDSHFGNQTSEYLMESESVLESYDPSTSDQTIYIVQSVDGETMQQDGELQETHRELIEEDEEESEELQDGDEETQIEEDHQTNEFHWSPISVNLLLNLRFARHHLFSLPNTKKTELWNGISDEMIKNNFNVRGDQCDMKYRNILKTYRMNKERRRMGAACNWVHFDLMDAYLGENSSKSENIMKSEETSNSTLYYNLIQEVVEEVKEADEGHYQEEKGFQWTSTSTTLLLNLRFARHEVFQKSMSKKHKLWNDISKEMRKQGFAVSGPTCDSKYRNLLMTYRKVKEKRNMQQGETFTRWRYFKLFDNYFTNHESTSSNKTCDSVIDHCLNDFMYDQQGDEDDEEQESSQMKKPKMTISRYLQFKMKAEERKRKDYLILEEKKLELEYKKLEMEQRKIEVFRSLVSVLKQGKTPS